MGSNQANNEKKFEIIDVFNHFLPKEYLDSLPKPWDANLVTQASKKPATDIEFRIKEIQRFGISKQILSLGEQMILDDAHYPVDLLPKLTRVANDAIARTVEGHSNYFYGIGTVTLHDVGEAIDELDRCVKDLGLLGVQILSNVGGKPLDLPELDAFYERLCRLGAGLWIHPAYMRKSYDWMNEYHLSIILGWGFDESLAVFRLVRGGVLERHPELKVVTHHMGVMIPFYADRIHRTIMREGKDGQPPDPLRKPAFDYLKMFYVDTAEGRWKPALVCSEMFYGAEHMMFATDYPFGPTEPYDWPTQIVASVSELDVTEEEKGKIFAGNVKKVFNLD